MFSRCRASVTAWTLSGVTLGSLRPWTIRSLPRMLLYELDRGSFAVEVRDVFGGAAHHLLAVGPQVGAGGVVVDHEVGHAADRGGGGDRLGVEVCDRPPRRVPAVGGARHADASWLCDAGLYQRFDAAPDVFLLAAAPAVLLDGLLEGEPEARAAPVVRGEHVEAARNEVLDLGVEPVFGVAGRAAVDQNYRSKALAGRSVEPTLYLQAVDGPPAEVFGRDERLHALGHALRADP